MGELGRKPFDIDVGSYALKLTLDNCGVNLFYEKPEVDYIAVTLEGGEKTLRIFNNEDLARWMAGLMIDQERPTIKYSPTKMNGKTFRELYGWNPLVLLRNAPNDNEEQWWTEVTVADLDEEWEHFGEDEEE